MIKFIFDLDGTLTTLETLPYIAKHFGIDADMTEMTQKTLLGLIPFEDSLRERVQLLGKLPVNAVSHLLASVPLYPKIRDFIAQNSTDCLIATGNIDVWLEDLAKNIPCHIRCSVASLKNNHIHELISILNKEQLVQEWKNKGYSVIFIGDGDNDVSAMQCADVAIGVSITHAIAQNVHNVADYIIDTEEELYELLCHLRQSYFKYK